MNQQANEHIVPPENEAYVKIYGIVADATCKLEQIVIITQDISIDMIDVDIDGMMYYLHGFTEDYNDGDLKTFINYVIAYREDELLAMSFLEELVAGGIDFYFAHNQVFNFLKRFDVKLKMTIKENIETYNKLLEVIDESWIEKIMNDFFMVGINLAMQRPEHESYIYNVN